MLNREKTQELKAIMVVMVFLQHTVFAVSSELYSSIWNVVFMLFRGDIAVAILMLISGFVLYKSFSKKVSNEPHWSIAISRGIRLVVPMLVAYLILYGLFKLGMGKWGNMLASMGYDWGFLVPIGMVTDLSFTDFYISFVGQLLGFNDQLLLVAWLLKYELICSILLLVYCFIEKKLPQNRIVQLVILLFPLYVVLDSNLGMGVIAAFWVGVIIAKGEDTNVAKYLYKHKMLVYLFVFGVYLMIGVSASGGYDWMVEQISKGNGLMVYLLSDQRYFMYCLILPVFSLVSFLLGKIDKFSGAMRWLGARAYSFYLTSQFSMMILAWVQYKLSFYITPLAFFAITFAFNLFMTHYFYLFVESKVMNFKFKIQKFRVLNVNRS